MSGRRSARALSALAPLAVAVLVLTACGSPSTDAPEALPSASPDTSTPSPSAVATDPVASGSPGEDPSALLAEIEEQVIELRDLPPPDIPPVEVISRAELADELEQLFDAEYPVEEREEDNVALRGLGLLTADEDYAELQKRLLGEQVLGFYDPLEERMVVVSDAGLDAEARLTYAHEYTHALQYAAFDLSAEEEERHEEDDASLALSALVEGDATLSMLVWAVNGGLGMDELLSIGEDAAMPDTSGVPSWMVELILFPYLEGQTFVASVAGDPDNPQAGLFSPDFAAVDELLAEPPETTEQIIHFDKWESREDAIPVEPVELAAPLGEALGGDWSDIAPTTMGEVLVRITLGHYGVPRDEAAEAAAGWGGDEVSAAAGPGGAFALAWRLAWDSEGDAEEFAAAYGSVVDKLSFEAELVELSDTEHLVLHASSAEVLSALRTAAGG